MVCGMMCGVAHGPCRASVIRKARNPPCSPALARPKPKARNFAATPLGVAFAGRERLKQDPSALTHDVREHRAELDVGGLRGFVDALDVAGLLRGSAVCGRG